MTVLSGVPIRVSPRGNKFTNRSFERFFEGLHVGVYERIVWHRDGTKTVTSTFYVFQDSITFPDGLFKTHVDFLNTLGHDDPAVRLINEVTKIEVAA